MFELVSVSEVSCVGATSPPSLAISSSCDDDSLDGNRPPIDLGFPLRVQIEQKDRADLEKCHALVKVLLLRSIQLLRDRREHLVRRRDELWISEYRKGVNLVFSANRTGGDVLLLGHPLCKESLCPEAHLSIVVAEWDRSLRWVVKRLDMHGGIGGS